MGSLFTQDVYNQLIQMTKTKQLEFTDETIRSLFGHEAAEDENINRLKEYYLKTDIYNSMRSNIPLYILVGHKGVGKSALLKVLEIEDKEKGDVPIVVQPDDILNIDVRSTSFLQKIRIWKDGLSDIVLYKLISSLNSPLSFQNEKANTWLTSVKELIGSCFGHKLNDLQKSKIHISNADFTALFKNALFTEKRVTVYLDDMDRGWKNSSEDIENLSAMLNAVRDLSRDTNNLNFRIALRSDVYYAVRTSDETTDKIDGSVLWQSWTNHEILVMLIKRIESFWGRDIDEEYLLSQKQSNIRNLLDSVFEERFHGAGHWANAPFSQVLMSLIRKRPRDLVKLCTLAAKRAALHHHKLIMTDDLQDVFITYSNDRLTDTGNEYQSELPNVKELLLKMKPTTKELQGGHPCLFTHDELLKKLDNIVSMSHFTFKNGEKATAQNLAAFLYKINFLTARKNIGDEVQRLYYDENQYIYNTYTDFGYMYEIHPAYRWALQPANIANIFEQIVLGD